LAEKMKNPPKALITLSWFIVLTMAHLFLQYKMVEIGTAWSYSHNPPSDIVLSLATALSYAVNPLFHMAVYVDGELVRIEDYWYYVSAVLGSMLWASAFLWVGFRFRKSGSNKSVVSTPSR